MCWPERLIGTTPNVYLYAANNPSEGALAKRRSAATLVSYLTPSLAQAGLYRGLIDLKASLERYRATEPEAVEERASLAEFDSGAGRRSRPRRGPAGLGRCGCGGNREARRAVVELEYTLIPHGLHVVGQSPSAEERVETLTAIPETMHGIANAQPAIAALIEGHPPQAAVRAGGLEKTEQAANALAELAELDRLLQMNSETPSLLRALKGRFIAPVAGGDLLRNAAILPTGRNLHGFDPYRIPQRLRDIGRGAAGKSGARALRIGRQSVRRIRCSGPLGH